MRIIRNKRLIVSLGLLLPFSLYANPRWYSSELLEQGRTVFLDNCSTCHGNKAQGTRNWQQTDKDGNYQPPPLNGEAHAWHHSVEILRQTIREGSIKLGGSMPPFKDKLNQQQIDAAIAYIQSQWTEEIYRKWKLRNSPSSKKPRSLPGSETLKKGN